MVLFDNTTFKSLPRLVGNKFKNKTKSLPNLFRSSSSPSASSLPSLVEEQSSCTCNSTNVPLRTRSVSQLSKKRLSGDIEEHYDIRLGYVAFEFTVPELDTTYCIYTLQRNKKLLEGIITPITSIASGKCNLIQIFNALVIFTIHFARLALSMIHLSGNLNWAVADYYDYGAGLSNSKLS